MTVLAGRYELGDELGAGGMARVVAAHDRLLDRAVAVKVLPPGSDQVARERFLREARAAARLRHPGVVAVHDTGEDAGLAFIVMELVRGGTLAELLEREGRLEVEEALGITLGVLEVLEQAHAAGMVHRDVKPANVLLPDDGGVKLADFGLAKALDGASGRLTTSGAVVGTPAYLAPELVEGGTPGPASDVYSVGCLLYALLAGHPPFTGGSALAVAYAHRHHPVPTIESERPEVPVELRAVLARALRKDPADRFADAGAMKAALLAGSADDTAPAASAPADTPTSGASGRASVSAAEPSTTETQPVGGSTEALPRPDTAVPGRRRRWVTVGVVAVVLPLALVAWLLGGRPGADGGGPDRGDQAAEPPENADGPPGEDPAPQAPEPGADPPADDSPTAPARPTDASNVTELIAVLADAPPGTYGEKHDDLLDDLLEISREEDPQERAGEAADLRDEIGQWVDGGELEPELGRHAAAVLAQEADAR